MGLTAAGFPSVDVTATIHDAGKAIVCTVQEVVVDPVTIADGSSYERGSIQRWFTEHNTSPVTGQTVDTRVVVPNSMMRAVAAMYRRQRGLPST